MNTQTIDRPQTSRAEAKAQRLLLRHRDVRAALRFIAHSDGFHLTEALIERAVDHLVTQPTQETAEQTVHQLRRALYKAESLL